MEIIHQGKLNNGEVYTATRLSVNQLHQILNLQQIVVESLEDKDVLQPLTEEEFRYILEGNGLMLGIFVNEKLIAFRALMVPLNDEEHLGRDLGLSEKELAKVIYQEISNVHPSYRGNRLQQKLAVFIMEELTKSKNDYKYICCTVAPFNIASLKDKFAQGMEIVTLKEKYGGRLRYVFAKEIQAKVRNDRSETITIPMKDTVGQQKLLSEGFRGFQMENRDGEFKVLFGKVK